MHIVETQQRHAAQQPTIPAPSAVELRRELAHATPIAPPLIVSPSGPKISPTRPRCFAQKQRTTSSGLRLICTLRSEPLSRITALSLQVLPGAGSLRIVVAIAKVSQLSGDGALHEPTIIVLFHLVCG